MLVIHPDECIDCGVCEPECPIGAIVSDSDPSAVNWVVLNRTYADVWPNITKKGPPPKDADKWAEIHDKKSYFSPNPGKSS